MANPKKRRKKKRKTSTASGPDSGARKGPAGRSTGSGSGGGVMQGIRSGFQRAAGVDDGTHEKPSTLSNVLWGVALLAAVGFLLYRFYG